MFVIIEQCGLQVERGSDLAMMLTAFYKFQPNDDIDVYVYDIANNQSTKIDCGDAVAALDSMNDFIESIVWNKSYIHN